jgi:hypothetical protein
MTGSTSASTFTLPALEDKAKMIEAINIVNPPTSPNRINGKNTGKPIVNATPIKGLAANRSTPKGTSKGNVHLLATYGWAACPAAAAPSKVRSTVE